MALSRLKHGFESRWGHHSMVQGFPGFLARFHDASGDPGKPQIDPGEAPDEVKFSVPPLAARFSLSALC